MGREMEMHNKEAPLMDVGGMKWGGKLERK